MPKTPLSYPATNGKAGGKLPAGNDTVQFPARSFSGASRKAATNHPYISDSSRRTTLLPRGTTTLGQCSVATARCTMATVYCTGATGQRRGRFFVVNTVGLCVR